MHTSYLCIENRFHKVREFKISRGAVLLLIEFRCLSLGSANLLVPCNLDMYSAESSIFWLIFCWTLSLGSTHLISVIAKTKHVNQYPLIVIFSRLFMPSVSPLLHSFLHLFFTLFQPFHDQLRERHGWKEREWHEKEEGDGES